VARRDVARTGLSSSDVVVELLDLTHTSVRHWLTATGLPAEALE
jgi:hypothetical protein